MLLDTLAEIVWVFYQEGRPKATNQSFSKEDMLQYLKMAFSNSMRSLYYQNKKLNDGSEYYFSSPILSVKRYPVSDVTGRGFRRADMSGIDLYNLPKNAHFTNVFPIGENCSNISSDLEITQVQPGEENFYKGDSFSGFIFYVVKGKGLDFYNLPACIKNVDIETTYDTSGETDISLDVAFDIANQVLGIVLKIPGFSANGVDNPYEVPQTKLAAKLATPATP